MPHATGATDMSEVLAQPLEIVSDELGVTLDEVRVALELYAEGEGPQHLERCAGLLHLARGVLQLTETYGASLLAEEMEQTCLHLLHTRRQEGAGDEGIEAVMRAAVQLPAYVDRILNGGRDLPLVLLPLLNDLRTARGRPLLSESTLLLLNLAGAAAVPAHLERTPSGEDIQLLCRELRPRFQLALLALIRGEDIPAALTRLGAVVQRLRAAATEDIVHQLWWIVEAVLEALRDGGLEPGISLKRLLGQADREMRRLQAQGESTFARQPPTDLLNNLLYYVARAQSGGPCLQAIRAAFNLSGLIPGDAQVELARQSLAAPSVKLMQTVAGAIREDLGRVKDVLDIYLRTGMDRAEELAPQAEMLKKIGDTLGVLGLGGLREMIQTRQRDLEAMAGGGEPPDEAMLVAMAADLLAVEDRLESDLIALIRPGEAAEADRAAAPEAGHDDEFAPVARAVLRECLVNLVRIKETITELTEHGGTSAAVDAVPGLLRGLVAALMMLGRERAAGIAASIIEQARRILGQGYPGEDRGPLERLADAIVSLEYYLETLQAGRREPAWMLDNAARSLAAIGEPLAVPQPGIEGEAPADAPEAGVRTRIIPDVDRPVISASRPQIDPEILELFIEEAREAIDTINDAFPAWQRDESSVDALQTVRRAFHTLKGSGRIVGAELIGEYCWSVEKILNRLIDGGLVRSAGLLALLERSVAALPELIEQLEVGATPATDIAALMGEAERWVSGWRTEAVAAPGAQTEAPAGAPASRMDPVLLDILSREMGEHLAVLREFLARAAKQGLLRIPEEVHRAVHTLHGSLTMARVETALPVTELLQEAVEHRYLASQPAEPALMATCSATIDYLTSIMGHLHDPAMPSPEPEGLVEQLGRLIVAQAVPAVDQTARLTTISLAGAEVPPPPVPETGPEPESPPELLPPGSGAAAGGVAVAAAAQPTLFDAELAAIYAEEAAELLEAAEADLQALQTGDDPEAVRGALQRHLHTLKGGARMAGLYAMGDLSHELESLLLRIAAGRLRTDQRVQALIQASLDQLHQLREQIAGGGAFAPQPGLLEQLAEAGREIAPEELTTAELVEAFASEMAGDGAEAAAESAPGVPEEAAPEEMPPQETRLEEIPTEEMPSAEMLPEQLPEEAQEERLEALLEAAAEREAQTAEREEEAGAPVPEEVPPAALPALDRLVELARELRAPPTPAPLPVAPQPAAVPEPRAAEPRETARVDAGLLERLLDSAGEISIANARLTQQLSSIQFHLEELDRTVVRLRNQLRKLEMETEAQILHRHQDDVAGRSDFDPLELDRYSSIQQLSRGLAETASDVSSLRDLLDNLTGDTEALLVQQARTANELQDGLMRTRMVPFQQHGSRLARLVRQVARDAGKQAELFIDGSGELDRHVLEQMLPAFEHMLRNAVVHGIEYPQERTAAGKPAGGVIRIRLHREGSEVVVEIIDDGRGLDVSAIRRKAVELGFIASDMSITDDEAMQFILRPGFSTADRLTQTAGRGVGMDVVASQIVKLGGTLAIDSRRGHGTTFTIRLPFTLAVTQALIVRVGGEFYALPLPTIEGVIRISREEFAERMQDEAACIDYAGQRYQLRYLGQLLGLGAGRLPDDQARIPVILVKAGESSAALVADEMLDSREVVVKSVGPQLATIRGITGATILGDGRIVVILDAGALVRTARPIPAEEVPADIATPEQPLALVVDDSITMRRVTQRFLERNGLRVQTAKDGVEAISVLQDHRPDIILLDVEMPRMDGYEFARHVRNNPETAGIPIIMITSRVSDKHRARAIECGVNDYLGKPYQEPALLEAVHNLLDVS